MSLLVVDHLQPVLHHAQKSVCIRQFVLGLYRDMTARRERLESSQSRSLAQDGIASAENELLSLDKELDFANATAAELDVVPADRNSAMPAITVDLSLDRMNVHDRGKIQMLSPNERLHVFQQFASGGKIAGALARLYPRGALPVLP